MRPSRRAAWHACEKERFTRGRPAFSQGRLATATRRHRVGKGARFAPCPRGPSDVGTAGRRLCAARRVAVITRQVLTVLWCPCSVFRFPARKILRCCPAADAMPTTCRRRAARCTPMRSARRTRMPDPAHRRRAPRRRCRRCRGDHRRGDSPLTDPFLIALKAPVHQWSLAVERVRLCRRGGGAGRWRQSRYIAEDAAELVQVDYEPLDRGHRSDGRLRQIGAAAASGVQDQRDFGPQFRLWRHRRRLRRRRCPASR